MSAGTKSEVDARRVHVISEIFLLTDIYLFDIEREKYVTVVIWRI